MQCTAEKKFVSIELEYQKNTDPSLLLACYDINIERHAKYGSKWVLWVKTWMNVEIWYILIFYSVLFCYILHPEN